MREAKALLVSCWYRFHNPGVGKLHIADIANSRYRAPDPWYVVSDNIVVRRLSPNNRKIEADDDAFSNLSADMLEAMGRELANVHLGSANDGEIMTELDQLGQSWLSEGAKKMADATGRDYEDYRKS